MKILVVEDDEDSRLMLCALLEGHGHDVVNAVNGKQALEVLGDTMPGLIISDILMPEMDGFDFCREVKADPELAGIPFIFYTATYTSDEEKELGLLLGASRFIIKPQEPDVLIKLIDEVVNDHKEKKNQVPQTPIEDLEVVSRKQLEIVEKKLHKKLNDLEATKDKGNKLSAELVQLSSEFDNVNDMLSQLTTATSHDLMEPLRKIYSFSNRLGEICGEHPDNREQVYLSFIERSSEKMKKYIEDLGAMARVSKADLVFEEVSLEEVFALVRQGLSTEFRNSRAKLSTENLHALISDKSQLIDLFKNIISNCLEIKGESASPRIHIKSQETEEGFIVVNVEVSDFGFDEEHFDRVFKPFQQTHGHSTDEASGIGPALCKKIAARLQGEISANSSPGKGAVFMIKLPLKPQSSN
jgi:signal transduction histidine kinase